MRLNKEEDCPTSSIAFGEAKATIAKLGGYVQEEAKAVDGEDKSFFIMHDGRIACVMPVFVINGVACFHDATSIVPYYGDEHDETLNASVNETICEWADHVLGRGDVRSIKILANDSLLAALSRRPELLVSDNTRLYGYVELSRQKDALWHSIRKSYRSLIRRGERNFRRTIYAGKETVDTTVIDFLVASPNTQFRYGLDRVRDLVERTAKHEATLLAYWLESKLVGVVGIASWHKFAPVGDHFYELGAYDHFSGVPTHFCLYDALSYYQSNGLGNRVFLLHGVPTERPENQSKLRKIDFYKMGYCSDTFTRTYKIVTLAGFA